MTIRPCTEHPAMMFHRLFGFGLIVILVGTFASRCGVHRNIYREIRHEGVMDHALRGHSFMNAPGVSSAVLCLALCLSNERCRSINYYRVYSLCQMNGAAKEDFASDFNRTCNASYFAGELTAMATSEAASEQCHQEGKHAAASTNYKPSTLDKSQPLFLECCDNPVRLGLEDGTIPDNSITASSNWHDGENVDRSTPAGGRLNKPDLGDATVGAWAPAVSNLNQWIQVDLGKAACVHGVLMQGRDEAPQWVKRYRVQYEPFPGAALVDILDLAFQVQIFDGSYNNHAVVQSLFAEPIVASTVRIIPVEWYGFSSLRFELLGCRV